MLSITILTLLITSNVISRIHAEEQKEREVQFNGGQIPVYEALKVQKRDTLNIVTETYVEQTNYVDQSQRGNRLRRVANFDNNFMKDFGKQWSAPPTSNRTGPVNYFGSRISQRNNSYFSNGENDVYGAVDVQIGNTFSDNDDGTNVYGPILVQEYNNYQGKSKNRHYGAIVIQNGNRYSGHPGKNNIYTGVVVQNGNTYLENPENKTSLAIIINQSNNAYSESIEANKDALKPIIQQSGNVYASSNDSEIATNTKNKRESQVHSAEQNATDSPGTN